MNNQTIEERLNATVPVPNPQTMDIKHAIGIKLAIFSCTEPDLIHTPEVRSEPTCNRANTTTPLA